MRKRRGYVPLFVVAFAGVLAAGVVAYFFFGIWQGKRALDAVPLSPVNYQPAALELVQLCQSNPAFFSKDATRTMDPFNPVWAPPSVIHLHPETVDIDRYRAAVVWGGGFYHCAWNLTRGEPTVDGTGHSWTISFSNEDGVDKVLQTLVVRSDFRLSDEQAIQQILTEYDRRLAAHLDDGLHSEAQWYPAAARDLFLQAHQRLDLLSAEVRRGANYPHDWRDVLLAYLMNQQADDSASGEKLHQWAAQTNGPAAWMYAAYAFYQAGDNATGDDAIKQAVASKAPDPAWIDKDVPSYELGMAMRLYRSDKFAEAVKLCDAILASPHRYISKQADVTHFRGTASAATTVPPAEEPEFDKFTAVDLFGGLDLPAALAAAKAAKR